MVICQFRLISVISLCSLAGACPADVHRFAFCAAILPFDLISAAAGNRARDREAERRLESLCRRRTASTDAHKGHHAEAGTGGGEGGTAHQARRERKTCDYLFLLVVPHFIPVTDLSFAGAVVPQREPANQFLPLHVGFVVNRDQQRHVRQLEQGHLENARSEQRPDVSGDGGGSDGGGHQVDQASGRRERAQQGDRQAGSGRSRQGDTIARARD